MPELPAHVARVLTRLSGWPRRTAALLCLIAAGIGMLRLRGAPAIEQLEPMLVTSRVLAAGATLTAADLSEQRWPIASVPADVLTTPAQAVGHRIAAELARGQPLVSGALLEPAIAAELAAGRVATTVSLADPNQLAILRPGVHIDLYADTSSATLVEGQTVSGAAAGVARNVVVIAILAATSQMTQQPGRSSGAGLIIATDRITAGRLADHLSAPFLATLVAPP